jgi:transposase InsO family protein
MGSEVRWLLLEARHAKPYWGPKKLLAILKEQGHDLAWPSPSAVSELFKQEGLSQPRRKRRRVVEAERPFMHVAGSNDVWCIDFKGWFRTGDGKRCDALTVSDAYSRYLLDLEIVRPVGREVGERMDRLFRDHGLPRAIRSDNGPPFASHGAGGLTPISAHWAKLGIGLERIQPGKPQQNGRHERMHGTLKRETCQPPQATPALQQCRFDAFRQEYNHERPHEALGQIPPCRLYTNSTRAYPARIEDPVYGTDEHVRRVRSDGSIKWKGSMLFVSEALIGEIVAIRQREDGHWSARFADVPLLLIDRSTGKAARYGPGRPPRSVATPSTANKVSAM